MVETYTRISECVEFDLGWDFGILDLLRWFGKPCWFWQ